MRRLILALVILSAFSGGQIIIRNANDPDNIHPLTCDQTAANLTSTEVQNKIDAASAGQTVCLPSGSSTWTTRVNVTKSLRLHGNTTCTGGPPVTSCTDNTNITLNVSGDVGFNIHPTSAGSYVRVDGISWTISSGASDGCMNLEGVEGEISWRLTNSHFTITCGSNNGGLIMYSSYGLIDHSIIDWNSSASHPMYVNGDWATAGFHSWARAHSYGTSGAVYVEDCLFRIVNEGDGIVDGSTGGRMVFRYNTVVLTGTSNGADVISSHGTDSGSFRSFFSWEVYNNTFTNNAAGTLTSARIRGGGFLWFSNTYNGSQGWAGSSLQNYRSDGSGNVSTWGNCDGTDWKLLSTDPSTTNGRTNSSGGSVSWCSTNRDTQCTTNAPCTGGGTCSTFFDESTGGSGYDVGGACRDNIGRTHDQVLFPAYAWLNTTGVNMGGQSGDVIENQDFYNYTASFTGASGVGSGTLASRPATCTTGVAYWATDTSTLYQCTSTNTWGTLYMPYQYPHALNVT